MTGHFLFDGVQLALSLFNCILLLWLGLTVMLNSERRTGGVMLISGTAFLGSTFFAAHTALLQIAGSVGTSSLEFWWKIGWIMLTVLPYSWYTVVLWYGGHGERQSRLRWWHRYSLVVLGTAMAGLLLALLLASPLPSFAQTLALQHGGVATILGVPWFLILYPLYTLACMALTFAVLHCMAKAAELEANLTRRRVRPWLVATTVLLTAVGLLVVWAIAWFHSLPRDGTISMAALLASAAWFDLAVSALVAAAVVLIGKALLHYEIFSGRTLPRRELRRHWNYALVLASGYGIVVGASLAYGLRPVYNLLLSAVLMTALFALTGWRTFARQQEFVRRLRPFMARTHLYEQLTSQQQTAAGEGGTQSGDDMADSTFAALCREVLNTSYAVLMPAPPLAMLIGKPLAYPPYAHASSPAAGDWMERVARSTTLCVPMQLADAPRVVWALPLHSGGQFVGVLLLGERNDGGIYTQEEIEVARATSERLIDLRASVELAQRLLKVQRTRLMESTVLDRQARRALHDDVLPDLHTALLLLHQESTDSSSANLAAASDLLMNAHRRIAELLRTAPIRPALQQNSSLLPSLRQLLAVDFDGQFDSVQWDVSKQAEEVATYLPAVTAEVVFYALREAIRNAARHGRGGDDTRALALSISACAADGLQIVVADDGVGADSSNDEIRTANGGQGLALHTALLAVVGATMTINSVPGQGTQIGVYLPSAACKSFL